MKKLSMLLTLVLSAVMFLGSMTVQATTSSYSIIPTSGNPSPYKNFGESSYQVTRAAVGLSSYCDSISYNGTTLIFSGTTTATHISSKIGNQLLQLQVWNGTIWQNVSYDSYYRNDALSYTATLTFTPTKDRYYRVAGIHLAIINGTTYTTSTTNYSDYIYVSP